MNEAVKKVDRRASLRVATNLGVELKFAGWTAPVEGRVLNISANGVFVHVSSEFPREGEKLSFSLEFDVGTKHHIHGCAAIKWVRLQADPSQLAGFGMEFGDLSASAQHDLDRLLRLLARKS